MTATSVNPKQSDNRCISLSWSTMSNAALRSRLANTGPLLLSIDLKMSMKMYNRAVSVLRPFLYADCIRQKFGDAMMNGLTLARNNFSSTFEMVLRLKTGR